MVAHKYYILCLVLFTVVLVSTTHSQTLLHGSISGTLSRTGNPYIVTDSCWVPSDSLLTFQAGVNVRFRGNYRITVNGTLQILGAFGDSVTFAPETTAVRWTAIVIQSGNTRQPIIRYASFRGAQYGIYAFLTSVQIQHVFTDCYCSFATNGALFAADSCWFNDSTNVNSPNYSANNGTFTNCSLNVGGLQVDGTGTFTNCIFTRLCSVGGNPTYMTDVQFVSGSNVGGVSVSAFLTRVTGARVRISDDNGGHNSTFTNCNLNQLWYQGSSSTITVRNCTMESTESSYLFIGTWPANAQGNIVQIDSTTGPSLELLMLNNSQVTVRNSLFYDQVSFWGTFPYAMIQLSNTRALFDRCTFVKRQLGMRDTALFSIETNNTQPVTIQNCVMYNRMGPIIARAAGASVPTMRYNAIESPRPLYNVIVDTTNRIGWLRLQNVDSLNDSLRIGSIAIDAADPALPLDPDSSRADCGAIRFDHRQIHPVEAWQDMTRSQTWAFSTDTLKNYVVSIWDTLPSVTVQLIPTLGPAPRAVFRQPNRGWDTLQISLLATRDTVTGGTCRVIVINNLTAPDTVNFTYRFYPSLPSILHDTILTRTHSPYWIARPVTIPRGDTVRIDSGVTIYHTYTPNTQPVWQVYGALNINGTANDSVRFQQVFPFGDHAWIGSTAIDSGGSLHANYWNLDTSQGYFLTKGGNGSINIFHSKLPIYCYIISRGVATFRNCDFYIYPYLTYGRLEISADSDSIQIINSTFRFRTDVAMGLSHFAKLIVDSCHFNLAGLGSGSSSIISHSIFYNSYLSFLGDSLIKITRNLLVGPRSIITKTVRVIPSPLPPMSLTNTQFLGITCPFRQYNNMIPQYDVHGCLFWQCDSNQLQDAQFGRLVRINRNGDSTDVFSNLFQNPLITDSTVLQWHFALRSPIRNGGVFDSLPYLGSAPDIGPWEIDSSISSMKESPIGLPTTFSVGIPYPNPTNGMFTISIQSPLTKRSDLTIFNCLGETILRQTLQISVGKNAFTIRCPYTLPTGLYFVQIGGENRRYPILLLK